MALIPKKPQAKKDVDEFISGAKASRSDQQKPTAESKQAAEKKMFSARIDRETVRKIKLWSAQTDKTKEQIAQEAFDRYFKNKDVPK
jgi:hypothetical protein